MNRMELVAAAAEKAGMTKKDTEAAVRAMLEAIEEALLKGEKVQLVGFGTFETRERPARQGKNPKTGGPLPFRQQESRCSRRERLSATP